MILAKQELNNIQQLVEKQVIFFLCTKTNFYKERKNIVLNNIPPKIFNKLRIKFFFYSECAINIFKN